MAQITLNDLMDQETKRNPSAFYARLREQGSLTPLEDFNGLGKSWIVTNYEDVLAILKDPRLIKDYSKIVPVEKMPAPLAWRRDMLTVDPPDHTRLRGLISKAFTPRMIENLRPRIQQITDALLDAVQERGTMDLIAELAFPLPITVISEMLGIPVEDRPQFRTWTQALLTTGAESGVGAEMQATLDLFAAYIKDLLAKKLAHPADDLTSNLVRIEESGDTLSENELISTLFLLIVAGHETTVNLIGNGTLVLLQHPEQMELLRQDASLLPQAIEELLRYAAPVTLAPPRWASEDVTLHGEVIHKGEMVFVSLIGANTDAQHFHDPDLLDITRRENQHVAFGKGIHFCLGAPLARLEGQIAIGTLLRRLPHLRLAGDPEQLTWTRTPVLRGLASLPVAF